MTNWTIRIEHRGNVTYIFSPEYEEDFNICVSSSKYEHLRDKMVIYIRPMQSFDVSKAMALREVIELATNILKEEEGREKCQTVLPTE